MPNSEAKRWGQVPTLLLLQALSPGSWRFTSLSLGAEMIHPAVATGEADRFPPFLQPHYMGLPCLCVSEPAREELAQGESKVRSDRHVRTNKGKYLFHEVGNKYDID